MRLLFAMAVLLLTSACGSTASPADVDCSPCGADEVCWYDYDFEKDAYVGHCAAWPSFCDANRTCGCLDNQQGPNGEQFCDPFGVQNSGSCRELNGRPLMFCETNLG